MRVRIGSSDWLRRVSRAQKYWSQGAVCCHSATLESGIRMAKTALVLYHYLYPDEVVSSVIFTQLCTGLTERGWKVVGSSGNRGSKDEGGSYPLRSCSLGVDFRRIWRPALQQSSGFGRIANAAWMVMAWSGMALNPTIRPDVLIIGTDPILSVLVALVWRRLRPKVHIVHWCFDLYPEAAIAAGLLDETSPFVTVLKKILAKSYGNCDLVVDIGECMRKRLSTYGLSAGTQTITPWALVEPLEPTPIDSGERKALFGNAILALLYSGSFGRAHSFSGILELAKALAPGGKVVFSAHGNSLGELRNAIRDSGAPIEFAPLAPIQLLEKRLSAADVHIVSLRSEWTGTVVPSKFFGALAIGRPVLFVGSRESAVARWIEELEVGWILDEHNVDWVKTQLLAFSQNEEAKANLFRHCRVTYNRNFSREYGLNRWGEALQRLNKGH